MVTCTQREKLLARYEVLKAMVDTAVEMNCFSDQLLNLYVTKLRYLKRELKTASKSHDYRVAIWAADSWIDIIKRQVDRGVI